MVLEYLPFYRLSFGIFDRIASENILWSENYEGKILILNSLFKVVNLVNGFFLWTNAVLLFSCIVWSIEFTGNIAVYILGSPFIIITILGLKDERKSYLMKNLYQLDSGFDFKKYINYYLIIVETKGIIWIKNHFLNYRGG
jgi:hypothetical protein